MAKKFYILDTNILLESPSAIFGFQDNVVVVPATVLQELDNHKRDSGDTGYNARESIRILEKIVTAGHRRKLTYGDFVESLGKSATPAAIIGARNTNGKSISDLIKSQPPGTDSAVDIDQMLKESDDTLRRFCGDDMWSLRREVAGAILSYRRWAGGLYCLGYALENGGILLLVKCENGAGEISPEYKLSKPDNMILLIAIDLSTKYHREAGCWLDPAGVPVPVILVSNDLSLRLNAVGVHDIKAQSYKNMRLPTEEIYTGRTEKDCSRAPWSEYYDMVAAEGVAEIGFSEDGLHENEYVLMSGRSEDAADLIAVYRQGVLHMVDPSKGHPMGINPRNAAQIMAIDALMAPVSEIPLVILEGPAGTAKTFLSIAAGVDQTIRLGRRQEGAYLKVVITRNNVLSDADHGFLPGDLEDKLFPLMAPFYDNLESIFSINAKDEEPSKIRMQVDDLFDNGVVEASSMAYIRGRSLSNTFLILDECQNATRGQMLTLLTRAAEGCKIVIAGCVDQIDNPHLDKYNNGLSFAIERFKDSGFAAQVTFTDDECVRSPLAAEASRLLVDN